MGIVYRNRPYEYQPPASPLLDQSFPRPDVLVLPSVGAANIQSNKIITPAGAPYLDPGSEGLGFHLDETSYYTLDTGLYSDTFTILVVFEALTSNRTTLWMSALADSGNAQQELQYYVPDGHLYLVKAGVGAVLAGASVLPANKVHVAVITWQDGVRSTMYINGLFDALVLGLAASWNTADAPALGRYSTATSNNDDSRTYLFAKWNTALNDMQARDLSINPWRLFQHRGRVPATLAASGGGEGSSQSDGAFLRRRCMPHGYLQGL